jgi:hypothetical protein
MRCRGHTWCSSGSWGYRQRRGWSRTTWFVVDHLFIDPQLDRLDRGLVVASGKDAVPTHWSSVEPQSAYVHSWLPARVQVLLTGL